MRVPMLARCPELFSGGRTVKEIAANIDIMPTVLDVAGVAAPAGLDGASMIPMLQGKPPADWRTELLYEYYWERNYPQTPTIHALRGDRYKFIRVQGVWDLEELYDMQEDPLESRNLIFSPQHAEIIKEMRERLFDILEETGGLNIPMQRDAGGQSNKRNPNRDGAAQFPPEMIGKP
jgi:N-acetylglucosamine-6-sulfatase